MFRRAASSFFTGLVLFGAVAAVAIPIIDKHTSCSQVPESLSGICGPLNQIVGLLIDFGIAVIALGIAGVGVLAIVVIIAIVTAD